MEIRPVAHIYTDFPEKFGIPRQAGLLSELTSRIEFEPEYAQPEAVKGLSGFEYIWIIWDFSLSPHGKFAASVCPPRLGGKETVGVFASRSPYRPNSLGLSCLKLKSIEYTEKGPVIYVSGADCVSGTPVYDIKPYIAFEDAHPGAKSGYVDTVSWKMLTPLDPENLIEKTDLTEEQKKAVIKILSMDPRSRFQSTEDPQHIYGFYFSHYNIKFTVSENEIRVIQIEEV